VSQQEMQMMIRPVEVPEDESASEVVRQSKVPSPKETWKNLQDLKIYTIVKVNKRSKKITVKTSTVESSISFETLNNYFVRYTPKAAGDSPPIAGEIWQNIHTSKKATIQTIQDGRMGKEIIWQTEKGIKGTTDQKSFVSNWRRIKQQNKWFLGINLLGKK